MNDSCYNLWFPFTFIFPGGWPLIGLPGDGTPWSINDTQFMREKLLGSPAFFTLSVEIDPLDTSNFVMAVSDVPAHACIHSSAYKS